jgi:thiol:disulfide interchange protein DsbD
MNTFTPLKHMVSCITVCVLLALLFITPTGAQQVHTQQTLASSSATGPHIEVTLMSEQDTVVPGSTMTLGVLFKPDPQWHTYWRNPGDSGEAPTIKWETEQELQFSEIQWPMPMAIPVAHLVNYGYEAENLLSVTVDIPEDISPNMQNTSETNSLVISADVSWLVCKEDCIPGWATLQLSLPIGSEASLSNNAPVFDATRALLPESEPKSGLFEITEDAIVFEVAELGKGQWRLFPFRSDLINHAAQQNVIFDNAGNTTSIVTPRSDYFFGEAQTLQWLVSDGQRAFYVNGKPSISAPIQNPYTSSTNIIDGGAIALFALMAFAGGLILNLMPCVLPILSIKAMALQNTQHASTHKLAYFAGVMFCFNVFALVIVLLQQGGEQVGWGFHMQEPVVIVLLAFLFSLIAMVLLDTLMLGSSLSNVGQNLVNGESAGSHFATGTLAVIVASPCTAPFMAAALGVALMSDIYVTFIIFNALAIGFALPLTLLFISKRAKSWLPKPGAWMETFKHILAFPMFATVAWLCWVFAGQLGIQAQFALLIMLILFCMFIFILGRSTGALAKGLNSLAALLCFFLAVWLGVSGQQTPPNQMAAKDDNALAYVDFNRSTLTQLQNEEQVVVVNMTADWCITCKVNEQVAFSNREVKQALSQDGVTYMLGDWTNKNNEILQYLNEYQRAGVPLYVVYSGSQGYQVLPQILTPNTVINAIEQAKEEIQNVN